MEEKRPARERQIMLDVMKGVCISMVILTHVSTIPVETRRRILYPFTILPAVPIFIMLSAYVYTLSAMETDPDRIIPGWFENKRFWRRIDRILVLYGVSILFLSLGIIFLLYARYIPLDSMWKPCDCRRKRAGQLLCPDRAPVSCTFSVSAVWNSKKPVHNGALHSTLPVYLRDSVPICLGDFR